MADWAAITILREAHQAGLDEMAALEQGASDLRSGKVADALAAFRRSLRFFDGDLQQHFPDQSEEWAIAVETAAVSLTAAV